MSTSSELLVRNWRQPQPDGARRPDAVAQPKLAPGPAWQAIMDIHARHDAPDAAAPRGGNLAGVQFSLSLSCLVFKSLAISLAVAVITEVRSGQVRSGLLLGRGLGP